MSTADQPVSNVTWVPRDELRANQYNPNVVPSVELELLKVSIREDGWTQPIVVREDKEIVDGFHRWTVSGHPEIRALTDGLVPVVILKDLDPGQQILATVRHNRARGVHGIVPMGALVRRLIDEDGLTPAELVVRLGMTEQEV